MNTNATSPNVRRPIAFDIFSGIGGLGLGLEQAGFDVLVAVENNEVHADVHRFNFPWTEVVQRNAARVTGEDLRAAAQRAYAAHGYEGAWDGTVDLVCGGPPCQGFSLGGTHSSTDPRNSLLKEFARIVIELRPRYFLMENVPGLLAPRHARRLEGVLKKFRAAGYTIVEPVQVLNASDFGVPQDRTRVILLGSRAGESPVNYPDTSRSSKTTVADAIGDLPAPGTANLVSRKALLLVKSGSGYVGQINGEDPNDYSYPRGWVETEVCGFQATDHSDEAKARFKQTAHGQMEPISRYRRLSPSGLCNTLRSGTGPDHGSHTPPRPIHHTAPRVISVREAARLQSFPDWFRFHATKWHAWRGIGNSVPPLLARAVGEAIVCALGIQVSKATRVMPLAPRELLGYAEGSKEVASEGSPITARTPRRSGTRDKSDRTAQRGRR